MIKTEFAMRYEKQFFSSILFLGLSLTGLQAQETIPASGGNVSNSSGSVSYSIGQVVYTTNSGTDGSIIQGVQQPYEISVLQGIEENIGINIEVSTYPNPATEFLKIKVDASAYSDNDPELLIIKSLSYQLFDLNGKILINKNVETTETSVPTGNLIPGTYILRILMNQGKTSQTEIKSYKIIKN